MSRASHLATPSCVAVLCLNALACAPSVEPPPHPPPPPAPAPTTYYRTNFADSTTGPFDLYVYPPETGSCEPSTDYADPGSTYSMKCTILAGTGSAALQAWFGNGKLAHTPPDPSRDQDLFQEVRFVLGAGATEAVGGLVCLDTLLPRQFKVHMSRYGQVGANTNGWVLSAIGPCSDGPIGLFTEAERYNLVPGNSAWPNTFANLHEGAVYDVVYRYHRYTAQDCGTIAVWVNGMKVSESDCWPDMGATYGSAEGLLFWDGAAYMESGLLPLTVYTLFAQATNFPIGSATASP